MRVTGLHVTGYRSVRDIWFPVDPVGVFVGGNGTGKSNLYRSLELLHQAATGTLAASLAAEGGMGSACWAGPRKQSDERGIVLEADIAAPGTGGRYRYRIGIDRHPTNPKDRSGDGFPGEARVHSETLEFMFGPRSTVLLERRNRTGWAVDDSGKRHVLSTDLMSGETALSSIAEGASFPDLEAVRRMLSRWRFYHLFRSDPASPLRRPAHAVSSPSLDPDGANLAAVLATACILRDRRDEVMAAVGDAFPGAGLNVPLPGADATFSLKVPGLDRDLSPAELSDGQIRYLALVGALLSYRPPPFVALNEPETSLHPSMLPALARLVIAASRRSQVWLVTHSETLAGSIAREAGVPTRTVIKRDGATWIEGLGLSGFDDAQPIE